MEKGGQILMAFVVLILIGVLFYYFTNSLLLLGAVLIIGGILIFWGSQIIIANAFEESRRAEGNIDDAYQKRHDVLIKMLDTLRSDISKRDEDIEKIISLAEDKKPQPMSLLKRDTVKDYEQWFQKTRQVVMDKISKNSEMNNQSHQMLMRNIQDVEENLSAARRFYNHAVSKYNQNLHSFPGNIIKKVKNYEEKTYFKIVDESIKEDIKISLD